MTQKLESFFNLNSMESEQSDSEDQLPLVAEPQQPIETTMALVHEQLTIADRIDQALPTVRGLDTEDKDLDDYASKAMDSYDRLMDLGFNMDDRNAGKIFEVASTMMGNAITAKTAKLDKKLKMIDLQLKAAKLAQTAKTEEDNGPQGLGELTTDRNAILNLISQNLKNKDK
jgi:hypothetical protein